MSSFSSFVSIDEGVLLECYYMLWVRGWQWLVVVECGLKMAAKLRRKREVSPDGEGKFCVQNGWGLLVEPPLYSLLSGGARSASRCGDKPSPTLPQFHLQKVHEFTVYTSSRMPY